MTQFLQAHSSTFYLLSLVALCCVLLAVSIRASQVFLSVSKLSKKLQTATPTTSVSVTGTSYLPISVVNRLALISAISTAFACGIVMWTIFDRFDRTERVTLKNVHVLQQTDANTFTMEVRDKEGEWMPFTASFCPDSHITPEIKKGVTLLLMVYEEDRHLHCFDVRQPNGYVLWRNDHNEPIVSTFAPDSRQTTSSCPAEGPAQTAQGPR